jgi:hypothetical protein
MRLKSTVVIFCVWSTALTVPFQAPIQAPIAPQLVRDVRVFDDETVLEHRSV